MADYRIEHDSMGEVRVPKEAKWQAQTQRAVENFPISGLRIDRYLVAALASLKGAAAMVNARLKVIDNDVARAIHDAAVETMESLPRGRRRDPDSVADAVKRGVRAAVAVQWGKKPLCIVHILTI